MLIRSLDFVYIPSKNVDTDLKYYAEKLGAEVVFNIKDMGTQVAQVKLGDGPRLLLAGHLEGEVPILVYRVDKLKQAIKELKARGWRKEHEVELPHGPCCTFTATGGQRFAIYQLVRPEADSFLGRKNR